MTTAAPMQGTYIPQYTPVPPTAVPLEQQMAVETSSEHASAYSYQQSKMSKAFKVSVNVLVEEKQMDSNVCTPGSTGAEVQQTEFLGLTNKQTAKT
ncbi:RNA-binding motif, single-stranded-interacting protein 3 [Ophiophagus hannah]|uniref:RNA-binding motif, single-stranded-interacting protein 3 n=1 Tax=Ophiophagus hannah TaxID=8665 RepID=V8N9Z0_OPHHA|nr:RNA-binding motif, single-stranded-interacting protein 3 [Ophiophagus hannah]